MNRLKNISIIFLLSSFLFSFIISCDSTNPKPPEKPPGYQEDIPWPSLADSPWPIHHGDPQSTGRSSGPGPTVGDKAWQVDNLNIHCGIVIGNDSVVYVASEPNFSAFDFAGNLLWETQLDGYYTVITPIITNDNSIYVFYGGPPKLYRINPDGNIRWELSLQNDIGGQLNMCPDGFLFFISENRLFSVSNEGNIDWSLDSDKLGRGGNCSFSPDGNTLYINGNYPNYALVAVDIPGRQIKWTFGTGGSFFAPLIDANGNIYFTTIVDSLNNGQPALYSLDEHKNVRWSFPHQEWSGNISNHSAPTMDKFGNLYFGRNKVYSLDYNGKLRWEFHYINISNSTPYVCDSAGNVYITTEGSSSLGMIALNSNGHLIWEMTNTELLGESSRYSPAVSSQRIFLPTQDEYLYSIK